MPLKHIQLTGTSYRFGAPPHAQLALNSAVMPFDRIERKKQIFANLMSRESLGDEPQGL